MWTVTAGIDEIFLNLAVILIKGGPSLIP